MSVWLTPELKPFYGGTYFPPTSRVGPPGVHRDAGADRAGLAERTREGGAVGRIADGAAARHAQRPSATDMVPGARRAPPCRCSSSWPPSTGATADSPTRRSSPAPRSCCFFCASTRATGSPQALEMTLQTLRSMALGGMRDHIGGGFHRYSVDAAWRVPHFEKMLYDQAQLVLAFVEAGQASGDPFFLEVAEDTLLYVLREMTDPDGGFYCAEDADSVPPEQDGSRYGRRAPSPEDGRGVLSMARRRSRRAARGRCGRRQAALRDRAGRQCPVRSAAGIHRQEPALCGAIDRRAGGRLRKTARRNRRHPQPRRAWRCSSIGSCGRGRTGTIRFSRSGTA